MEWKLAEAKNKLSEVINKALRDGPQKITRRQDCVIIVDEREYNRLIGNKRSFKEHLMQCPSLEKVDFSRDRSIMRDIEL